MTKAVAFFHPVGVLNRPLSVLLATDRASRSPADAVTEHVLNREVLGGLTACLTHCPVRTAV